MNARMALLNYLQNLRQIDVDNGDEDNEIENRILQAISKRNMGCPNTDATINMKHLIH